MDITGIGAVATAAKDILGMIFPDKTEQEKAKLAASLALIQAQTDINKAEAASTDPLEHWRGGMGWVCVISYFNNFVLAPWASAFGVHVPQVDTTMLGELTLGMLGLGGMHVYQKVNQ
jgi:Holin of 3TMs, for gene-transfer release